ncbi:MAG TPA: glycoside hydrolase family 15 protein, partial [Terriglobales bacterium]|nr:glycoside hydrolase family 15 protein [Terriglobales bacterium]
ALLDQDRGGFWQIGPSHPDQFRIKRNYIGRSNVLCTRFTSSRGSLELTDCFPVMSESAKRTTLSPDHELLREVVCTEGIVEVQFVFYPRADFGGRDVQLKYRSQLGVYFEAGRGAYYLRSTVPLTLADGRATARFTLTQGEKAQFSFTYAEVSPVVLPLLAGSTRQRIEESIRWWTEWASCACYSGPEHEQIIRSALTLKLLTYAPSGAIVAAATTSLPESIGRSLNWDYRFCWLRDASLTIRVMIGLGYRAEAEAFMDWLLTATRLTQPELRILYTVFGNKAPKEKTLPHLSGFCSSRPVRIGNEARDQLQLDVYGEVLDAAAQFVFHGGEFDRATCNDIVGIGKYVAAHWDQPDQGIWEPREQASNHTYSRVLCWVALDRLITMADKGYLDNVPIQDFKCGRERIMQQVKEQAWNVDLNSYVSTLGGQDLDASLLLMSYYGFEAADSPRMQGTYRAIRKQLGAAEHLLYRYPNMWNEGAFGICSFWEAEFLALGGGTLQQAEDLLGHLMQYANDVGLYAEEIEPHTGDALGNFPQAFTHIGLVSAALSINERRKGERQLAHRKPEAQEATPTA